MEKEFKIPKTTVAGGATGEVLASMKVPVGQMIRVTIAAKAYDATAGDSSLYEVTAAVKNVAGTAALVGGSPSIVSFKDGADALTVGVATDTFTVLADATANDTVFEGMFSIARFSIVPV